MININHLSGQNNYMGLSRRSMATWSRGVCVTTGKDDNDNSS